VVVAEVGYLGRPEDVELIEGAAEAIAAFNEAGAPVVLVTNQAGIARGHYDWAGFEAVQAEIERRLQACGARLDAVLACGYHADGQGPLAAAGHPWRKPAPGMLLDAAEQMRLDLRRSWIAGDKAIDLEAGRAAGLAGGLHLATGHGANPAERAAALALGSTSFQVATAEDLLQGARGLGLTGRLALA
jgi:D-glycero-D-manno-heptose 1,7-bisphosphate phosphatase